MNAMNWKLWVAVAFACGCLESAAAQSLRARQIQADQERRLAESEVAPTAQVCGKPITGTFDWSGFQVEDLARHSAHGYCGSAFSALRQICGDALGKQAVAAKVNGVTCRFGGPGQRAMSLSPDGMLTFSIDWGSANDSDFATDWLKDNL
jgi:hypothetical protein